MAKYLDPVAMVDSYHAASDLRVVTWLGEGCPSSLSGDMGNNFDSMEIP